MKKYSHNSIFGPGPNPALNACVGDNGGPYRYNAYGEGFFHGGQYIIDAIKQGKWTIDLLIYPAVFNFRHGIELYLKHFLELLESLSDGDRVEIKRTHNLIDNWDAFNEALSELEIDEIGTQDIENASKIIHNFISIDPSGQVFRYPEDIKGNRHLTDLAVINVEILFKNMMWLFDFFETCDCYLCAHLEYREMGNAEF